MSIGTRPRPVQARRCPPKNQNEGRRKMGLALKVFAWMVVIGFGALVALVVGIIARFLWIIFFDE